MIPLSEEETKIASQPLHCLHGICDLIFLNQYGNTSFSQNCPRKIYSVSENFADNQSIDISMKNLINFFFFLLFLVEIFLHHTSCYSIENPESRTSGIVFRCGNITGKLLHLLWVSGAWREAGKRRQFLEADHTEPTELSF